MDWHYNQGLAIVIIFFLPEWGFQLEIRQWHLQDDACDLWLLLKPPKKPRPCKLTVELALKRFIEFRTIYFEIEKFTCEWKVIGIDFPSLKV